MSIYGASDFWDEHDFGEFDDVQEEKEIQIQLKKKKYVGKVKSLYPFTGYRDVGVIGDW